MGKIGVLFVCYGNICRSPMAEFVFRKLLDEEGLADRTGGRPRSCACTG